MKGTNQKNSNFRRWLVRGILLAVYAIVMVVAFVLGKGHTILIDNKDSEDGAVKAFESLTVSVNGGEPIEFMAGDRDMVKVRAQWHTIKIVADGQTLEKKVTLPLAKEMVLLSIPKLVKGVEPALTPFIPKNEPPPPEEPIGNSNEFTSPETPAVDGAVPPPVVPTP